MIGRVTAKVSFTSNIGTKQKNKVDLLHTYQKKRHGTSIQKTDRHQSGEFFMCVKCLNMDTSGVLNSLSPRSLVVPGG